MMYSRILALLVVVAATLWIGSGVLGRTEDAAEAPAPAEAAAQPLFRVGVMEARVEQHAPSIAISGRTEADDRATAVARAAGSIVELRVERGDRVKEGDVVAVLSDEAREAQVAQAQALVDQRRTDLDAKLKLIERGITPANERDALEANLRAAEATLAQAEAELERGTVRAPISGVISDVPVTTGQALLPNAAVAEVIALDPMLAVIEVAERQLGGIEVGDRAAVRLVTGQTAEGVVRFVSPSASEGTRTYRVDVEVANSDGAIPDGVTAEVELELAPAPAMRVARSALTFSPEGRLSVKTVGVDGAVASVPVSVVEDAPTEIWIAGPEHGADVIVQGQDFVTDGQRVDAVPVGGGAASALISRS
jgi:multidrug efflux system membrane fusion protein